MNKIYKYRPLNDFLFKELYYQELYFASYLELNDPLDLSARMDFSTNDSKAIAGFLHFLLTSQFCFRHEAINKESNTKWLKFIKDKESKDLLKNEIFKRIEDKKGQNLWTFEISSIIKESIKSAQLDLTFDKDKFEKEIQRLTDKFLRNSFVSCFSETNSDFLMWSHYSSKHSGICLEFTLENAGMFPFEMKGKRGFDKEKYLKGISEWESKSFVFWDRIKKVEYVSEQPYINFFDFSPVWGNEHDCDLIGLSKSWTHRYAHELEQVFSKKTSGWEYENEWRLVEINFDTQKEPEDRIRHYPIEALTAIYFGVNTPNQTRNRIYKMLRNKSNTIDFFESKLNGTNNIEFYEWEFFEE